MTKVVLDFQDFLDIIAMCTFVFPMFKSTRNFIFLTPRVKIKYATSILFRIHPRLYDRSKYLLKNMIMGGNFKKKNF